MGAEAHYSAANRFLRVAREVAELPGARWLAKPLYRRMFRRPHRDSNTYFGAYRSYQEAISDAPEIMPSSYNFDAAADKYDDRRQRLTVSDYPVLYWLSRLLDAGERRIFDLGGHIGVSYYAFQGQLDYPRDLRWCVHDVPKVVAAGQRWAAEHDEKRQLGFADTAREADGHDVLMSNGALQYLEYSLPELLQSLDAPPRHVLVNLTPMHPERDYFTLQNIGKAVLPYRVSSIPGFVAGMECLGYALVDDWQSHERYLRVPFEPACAIDCYSGFYFRKAAPA